MTTRANDATAGFTLIEMLVVLAILGVATGMTALALRPPSDERLVGTLATELRRELSHARMDALRSGRETTVRLDLTGRTVARSGGPTIAVPDGIAVDATVGREIVSGLTSDPNAMDGSGTASAASGEIVFLPSGGSSGGTIDLAGSTASKRVHVHWLTGIARIEP